MVFEGYVFVSIPSEPERKSNMLTRNGFQEIFLFELQSKIDDLISTCTYTRSENGFAFKRPGAKTGVENDIFLSEIGSGLGEPGGTPPPKIPGNTFRDKQGGDV